MRRPSFFGRKRGSVVQDDAAVDVDDTAFDAGSFGQDFDSVQDDGAQSLLQEPERCYYTFEQLNLLLAGNYSLEQIGEAIIAQNNNYIDGAKNQGELDVIKQEVMAAVATWEQFKAFVQSKEEAKASAKVAITGVADEASPDASEQGPEQGVN